MIKRADAERDPWSGHIAWPGGRWSRGRDLAQRRFARPGKKPASTRARWPLLGHLDDLTPVSPHLPPLVIRPYVALVRSDVRMRPNVEVAAAFWVPLAELRTPTSWGTGVVLVRGVERA